MSALTDALQALINAVNTTVTEKVAIDSIDPVDVGDATTNLEEFLQTTLNALQYPTWTEGSVAPVDGVGQFGDYYKQDNGAGVITIWENNEGIWVTLYTINISPSTVPDSIRTGLQCFIDGFVVTVLAGSWYINNAQYQILTQTQFTLSPADANYLRYDLIYASNDDLIHILEGTASISPTIPAVPANSIMVDVAVIPSIASGADPYLISGQGPSGGSGSNYVPGQILIPAGTSADITIQWQTDLIPGTTITYVQSYGNNLRCLSDWYEVSANVWNLGGGVIQPVVTFVSDAITTFVIPFTYDNSVNRKLAIS